MPEEAKDPMVELDVSGDSVDIELKEKKTKKDTPEVTIKEDTPEVKEEVKTEEKDEREEYSDGVKKRIDRLTYKFVKRKDEKKKPSIMPSKSRANETLYKQNLINWMMAM